jgi:maltose alpha-D-glucosyltransferase/alpha-amylase
MALWREVRAMFDREYPEAVLMSEWSHPTRAILGGFHVDFMLAFGVPPAYTALLRKEKRHDSSPAAKGGHSFFSRGGLGNIREFLDSYQSHYTATREHGYITIPSGNHDVSRLALGRSREEIEAVFALIMTMPGIPFIYNGDEIGMREGVGLASKEGGYNRTAARTPMQWDATANAGFSSAKAARLYLPIDPDPQRPTVAAQEKDPASLLHAVRKLARFRKEHASLFSDGEFTPLFADAGKYPFVYRRSDGTRAFVIAINPAEEPRTASFALKGVSTLKKIMGHDVHPVLRNDQCELAMPGVSYAFFEAA